MINKLDLMATIIRINTEKLYFDKENPRLVNYPEIKTKKEAYILNILWTQMAVSEIVMSILANGFFENEAMFVIKEEKEYIVVEGNRRLAAVKAILNPCLIDNHGMDRFVDKITPNLINELQTLPVIELHNREEAWRYIGFKHVNGAAKWDSYAKAKYIASVHNDFHISLENIAEQIGDENKLVIKFYQSLMILEQGNRDTQFKIEDTYSGRVFFSHLYTALGYPNYREYIGLDINSQDKAPIKKDKLDKLEDLLLWLYGSKKNNIEPVIHSQNPDLKNLAHVLRSKEAVMALKTSGRLEEAFDVSRDGAEILFENLTKAKMSLTLAMGKVSFYKGEQDTLKLSGTIANMADNLYDMMDKIRREVNGSKKQRLSE